MAKLGWIREVDCGNVPYYICPWCKNEQEFQSKHCMECGKRVITDDDIEEMKGTELRKDIPEYICFQYDCIYHDGMAGDCPFHPNPYELYCHNYRLIPEE